MHVVLRRALPSDAKVLSRIAYSAKAYWGYPPRWMEIWKDQFDLPPAYFEKYESWLAEADESPVGFYTLMEKEKMAWLENLWVEPDHIGCGIGRELFIHAVSRARLSGYLTLRLEADPNAQGFYEKMGMHKVGVSRYQVGGEPRLLPIMQMEL